MVDDPLDWALVKDGIVVATALHPVTPDVFGPEPDGEVVSFLAGSVRPQMLWDGDALAEPPAPADPLPLARASEATLLIEALAEAGVLSAAKLKLVRDAFAAKRGG